MDSISVFPAAAASGGGSVKVTFLDTSGSGTFTWDDAAVGAWVTLGAGGASGAGKQNGARVEGSPGGGAGETRRFYLLRNGGTTVSYTIGAGGVGTSGTVAGQDGGSTTFGGSVVFGGTAPTNYNVAGGAGGAPLGDTAPTGGAYANPGGRGSNSTTSAIRDGGTGYGAAGGGGGNAAAAPGGEGGRSASGMTGGAGGTSDGARAGGGGGGGGWNGIGGAGANAPSANGADGVGYCSGGGGCSGAPASTPLKGGAGGGGFILIQEDLE